MKGKKGEWVELDLHTGIEGTEAGLRFPHLSKSLEQRVGKHLKFLESEAADLWQSEWSENHADNL